MNSYHIPPNGFHAPPQPMQAQMQPPFAAPPVFLAPPPPQPQRQFVQRPGDWPCPSCRTINFSSRSACFKCSMPRPHVFTPQYVQKNVLPGDWQCPNPLCMSNVFASRDVCFRCSTPRPPPGVDGMQTSMRPGDWSCPQCSAVCFAFRTECFRCHAPKPSAQAAVEPHAEALQDAMDDTALHYSYIPQPFPYAMQPAHIGFLPFYASGSPGLRRLITQDEDWACTSCGEVNFGQTPHCLKCHAPRPEDGDSEQMWLCVDCNMQVSLQLDQCPQCQHPRDAS